MRQLDRKKMLALALLGVLNIFLGMSMLQFSIANTGASTAAALICSNPIFVLLFSVGFQYEPFSRRKAFSIGLGITGVFALLCQEKGFGGADVFGKLCGVLASVFFGLYIVLSKRTFVGIPLLPGTVVMFAGGILSSALFIGLSPSYSFALPATLFSKPGGLLLFVYVGVVISGLAYITFFRSLQQFSATASSIIFIVKPAIACSAAVLFLGEQPTPFFFAGVFCISVAGLTMIYD